MEGAIKRDYLSPNFESTSELLDYSNPSGCAIDGSFAPETVPILPWIAHTTAAVAQRLMEFDTSILYMPRQKIDSQKDKGPWVIVSCLFIVLSDYCPPILLLFDINWRT